MKVRSVRSGRPWSARLAADSTESVAARPGTPARLGFTARGVVYILIGLLAIVIARGDAAPQADRTGALQAIADPGWCAGGQ